MVEFPGVTAPQSQTPEMLTLSNELGDYDEDDDDDDGDGEFNLERGFQLTVLNSS